jgi:phosphopantothenoylcysteine decarboxylase/phosphopantothenate--cysteine ligase
MSGRLAGRRILLGVSGGIAAYKACELLRLLQKEGAQVQAVLSPRAARFVTPLTFSALTGKPTLVDEFASGTEGETAEAEVYAHLELTRGIDAFVLAPASADLLGKLAHGIADSLLTTCCLSNTAPLIIAPAMNVRMWNNAAVQANVATLGARGSVFVGPEAGELACGDAGEGRLAELPRIVDAVVTAVGNAGAADVPPTIRATGSSGALAGRRVIVCGGATREYLDPVRFITNASSGRLALETVRALLEQGAAVELVHTGLEVPTDIAECLAASSESRTGFDLQSALVRALPQADALVMLAAVADYAPAQYLPSKRKKEGGAWQVELHETADVLGSLQAVRSSDQLVVGVSLEDTDWLRRAMGKAQRKGMDACLAVELGADLPFGEQRMRCALVDSGATLAAEMLRSKPQAAALIADWLAARFAQPGGLNEHSSIGGNQVPEPASKEI